MEYYENDNRTQDSKELNPLNGNGETILIIDDEEPFVEVTKLLLEYHGYTILTAYDGVEGISVFSENKEQIKIIVCDLNMPRLGGRSILQKVLEIEPTTKILIISGSIEEDYIVEYLVSDKIDFLQKPFLIEKLLISLKQLLYPRGKNGTFH